MVQVKDETLDELKAGCIDSINSYMKYPGYFPLVKKC